MVAALATRMEDSIMASRSHSSRFAVAGACALVAIGWIGAGAPAAASPLSMREQAPAASAFAAASQAERICGPKKSRARCARPGR
jgi:hypothetical protein